MKTGLTASRAAKKRLIRTLAAVFACLFLFAACAVRPVNTDPATKAPADFDFTPSPEGSEPPGTLPPDATADPTEAATGEASPSPESTLPPESGPVSMIPTEGPTGSMPAVTDTALPTLTPGSEPTPGANMLDAVFLGVKGYGHIGISAVSAPGAKVYRFMAEGRERLFSIRNTGGFPIQNLLMEGYRFRITLEGDEVVSAALLDAETAYSPAVSGTPGRRTLKNFLTTACMPLGTALYVYGGGWDWQDEGSSVQARSLGVSGSWVDFFRANDADYLYKDSEHPESSYYPFGHWNEYYYAGLDCSGYLGWALYNTLESTNGRPGYVTKSSRFAKTLAEKGYGSFSTARYELGEGQLRPGDIVSMNGHVWICLGRCGDGSIVILHSSPTNSVTGRKGGGVQLSALDPNNSRNCEAYRLASYYQQKYFPEWNARYPVSLKSYSEYVGFDRTGTTGVFRWHIGSNGLTDPDGYAGMSAAAILADIFGE